MHTVQGVRNVKGLEVLKLKPHLEKWVISSAIVFRFVIINPTSPSLYSPGQKHDLELKNGSSFLAGANRFVHALLC